MKVMVHVRKSMKDELKKKEIFEMAAQYSYQYIDEIQEQTVFPNRETLKLLANFDEDLNEGPSTGKEIINMLHKYGSPNTVAQTGGRYFGFVNGGIIPAAHAAKWLSDTWDQNAAMFVTSPISSKLESIVENWLVEIFELPEGTTMGLVGGTSTATFIGLATARNYLLGKLHWNVIDDGLFGAPKLRIIISEQAHGSVFKALALLGLGKKRIEKIPADDQGRIITNKIPELDESCIVILQAGNVNSGAFDDFDAICAKANKAGSWVHIDGAFGLWAHASPKMKKLTQGINKADTWSVDGHKTLNTPYDCGVILCKNKDALVSAMQASGEYLQLSEHRDGMMMVPEMSRRARSIEIWASLKFLGKSGLAEIVDGLCDLAIYMSDLLRKNNFYVLNDVVFNQVLVACNSEKETRNVLNNLQRSGELWLGNTVWEGKFAMRISICSWFTTKEDIQRSVGAFTKARDDYRFNLESDPK